MLLGTIFLCFSALNVLALPVEKAEKPAETGEEYFLPNVIIPENYEVTIDVTKSFDEGKPTKFTGIAKIRVFVNERNIDEIVLHSADLNIKNEDISIKQYQGDQTEYFDSITTPSDDEKQFLKLKLKQSAESGKRYIIEFKTYEGKLHDDMRGFYVSQYTESGKPKPQYVLTTQFQPTHARRAFPCFDEPKYKATFDLTFKKPKGYRVISNTVTNEVDHGLNSDVVPFEQTPKMSTYLVAFIVHKFAKSTTEDQDYNVWSRPEAKDQTKWATDYMKQIVDDLSKFTGIEYKQYMKKMDMAALSDFSAGAMENWGLLTYRETALLVDENLSTNKDIQRVVSVIAHEVAHQWFGDLVTLTWWDNTWINEGFARYFEYHTTGNVLPSWEMDQQFVVEQQQSVFGVDALAKSTPLTLPVYSPSDISAHFGTISYGKGGSVIRMMEHFLGSDNFQKGLQHYLDSNRLENTEPKDLFAGVQYVVDEKKVPLDYPLNTIMNTWITQAGYPVVNVKSDGKGHFDFSQERFFLNPDENTAENQNVQRWFVPISYTTSEDLSFNDTSPKFWLAPHDSERTITEEGSDYLIVNIQETGYYRVNYDKDLWKKIGEALSDEKEIHQLNKAQIIDDVLNLARAGKVDYEIAFDITDYLAKETNYYPWYSAFQGFRYLLQRYSDAGDTGKELRTYLKGLMEKLVEEKEFDDKETEQIAIFNKMAALDWACKLGLETCVEKAKALFKDQSKIPKNLKAVVYCTAIRHGTKDDWQTLWKRFMESNVAAEKISIISALGCSSDDDTLKTFLGYSIDPNSGIRKQDAYYVFSAVFTGGDSKGVDAAFTFLKNNFHDMINNYNGMNDLEKAVLGVGGRLTDETKIKEFKKLLKDNEEFAKFRDAAIETVNQNLAWAGKYNKIIGDIVAGKNSAVDIIANKYVIIFLGFITVYFNIFN